MTRKMTREYLIALIEWNEQRSKLTQYEDDACMHYECAWALQTLLSSPPAAEPPPAKPPARARKRAH